MGFGCFICSEPFEEIVSTSDKGGGDGHMAAPARVVSTITKCGHLFHYDCLKKRLEAQSGNAWAAKHCPICQTVVTIHDIMRVRANPHDSRQNQRPSMEELMMAHRKLNNDYNALCKTMDSVNGRMRDMDLEIEALKRQNDELRLRLEHMGRLNSISKADIDRYKGDIDKFKNIIITLTEKLTGNDYHIHEFYGVPNNGNGVSTSNVLRLEYTEELQRIPAGDTSGPMPLNIIAGSLPRPLHPPGFTHFPLAINTENGSDGQQSNCGSLPRSISPDVQRSLHNSNGCVIGNSMMRMTSENQQQALEFALDNIQIRDYDSNNNQAVSKPKTERQAQKKSTKFDSRETVSGVITEKGFSSSAEKAASANYYCGRNEAIRHSKDKLKGSEKPDADSNESDEPIDKWCEKKSRRRGSSKSSGGNRGDKSGGKHEFMSDRRLLYGSFLCPTCRAKWGSSQSVLNTPQTCRYCQTPVHPYSQGPILSRKQLELNKQSSSSNSNNSSKVAVNVKNQITKLQRKLNM